MESHLKAIKTRFAENEHHSFLRLCIKNDLEKAKSHYDNYPLFKLRSFISTRFYSFRQFVHLLVKDPRFEALFLVAIIANMVLLVVSDSNDPNSLVNRSDVAFLCIFIVELSLKLLGMGLFTNKTGYFRDVWNVLDFVIVIFSGVNLLLQSIKVNLSALRTFRVLRPLKTISSVKKLRTLIVTIFSSLPFLLDIVLMLGFIYLVYSIAGVHLYSGVFMRKCYSPVTLLPQPINNMCADDSSCPDNGLCISDYTNLWYGLTSFDNIFSGMLLIHQIITANGFKLFAQMMLGQGVIMMIVTICYYISLIFFGGFLTLNLMLAVIVVKFTETENMLHDDKKAHHFNCACVRGLNFQVVRDSGCFIQLSQLKKNLPMRTFVMKYTYHSPHENDQKVIKLTFERDYSFWMLKPLAKVAKRLPGGVRHSGNVMSVLYRMRQHRGLASETFGGRANQADRRSNRLPRTSHLRRERQKVDFYGKSDNDSIVSNELRAGQLRSRTGNEMDLSVVSMTPKPSRDSFGRPTFEDLYRGVSATSNSLFKNGLGIKRHQSFLNRRFTNFLNRRTRQIGPINIIKGQETSELTIKFDPNFEHSLKPFKSPKPLETPFEHLSVIQEAENQEQTDAVYEFDQNSENEKVSIGSATEKSLKDQAANYNLLLQNYNVKDSEAENVLKSDMADLELVLNDCPVKPQKNMFSSEKDVFPRINEFRSQSDFLFFNQTMIDNETRTHYSLKMIYEKSKLKQTLESPPFHNFGVDKQIRYFSDNCRPRENRSVSVYERHFSALSSFYFYIRHVSGPGFEGSGENVCPVVNAPQTTTVFNRKHQSNLKERSRNYQTLRKFFDSEFKNTNAPKKTAPNIRDPTFNTRMILYILKNDVASNQKSRRVWSGLEVLTERRATTHKTNLIFRTLNTEVEDLWLKGFYGGVRMWRRIARSIIVRKSTENFFLGLVIANVVFLALDGLANSTYARFSNEMNFLFTALFVAETALKIFGLGIPKFTSHWFNIVEFFIAVISCIEVGFTGDGAGTGIRIVRVFRSIRVLRVTKIFKSLKFMRIIGEVISDSIEHIFYIALLLLLFLTIFAMVGAQMFNNPVFTKFPGWITHQGFENFYTSFVAFFSVMTVQNWTDVLETIYLSEWNVVFGFIIIFVWIVIGNYILLNLFVAILLNGFSNHKSLKKEESLIDEENAVQKLLQEEAENVPEEEPILALPGEAESELSSGKKFVSEPDLGVEDDKSVSIAPANYRRRTSNFRQSLVKSLKDDEFAAQNGSSDDIKSAIWKTARQNDEAEADSSEFCNESLFLFKRDNPVRRACFYLAEARWYQRLTFITIILSSLKLVIDTYDHAAQDSSVWYHIYDSLDYVFNFYFIIETTVKIIERGLIIPTNSYLRDWWTIIDMLIVVSSIIEMSFSSESINFLKTLRVLRTFRTLRFISHNRNLKLVVVSLLESIGGIVNVSAVIMLFWIMYGILGINLLSGRMGYCNFPDDRNYYYVNTTMCPELGGEWQTSIWNFDNIFNAIMTLFGLTSMACWEGFMYSAMDANDPSIGPVQNVNYYISAYYMVFALVSGLFLSNLFIGIIFYEFTTVQNRKKQTFFRAITEEQNRWLMMQKLIKQAEPNYFLIHMPQSRLRRKLFEILVSNWVEVPMMLFIILNTIVMAMAYENANPRYNSILDTVTLVCICVFVFEALIKLIIQGPVYYFRSNWNKFDFLLAVMSVIDISLSYTVEISFFGIWAQVGRVVKLVRITRILKIVKSKKVETLNRIVQTLIFSFPALLNIFALLVLIYFFYAILGVFLFKGINPSYVNFTVSFVFTFKMSLGESWYENMIQTSVQVGPMAYLYYLSYIFVTLFVALRMFVFVLIQQFESFYLSSDNIIDSFDEISNEFQKTWLNFTKDSQGTKIHKRDLYSFFISLRTPLGFHVRGRRNTENSRSQELFSRDYYQRTLSFKESYVRRKITDMNLCHDENGYISFGQVLHAAMKRAFGEACFKSADSYIMKEIRRAELKTIGKIFGRFVPKKQMIADGVKSTPKKETKFANPFSTVIFSQVVFKIWYRQSRRALDIDDGLSNEYMEMIDKNGTNYFEEKIQGVQHGISEEKPEVCNSPQDSRLPNEESLLI